MLAGGLEMEVEASALDLLRVRAIALKEIPEC